MIQQHQETNSLPPTLEAFVTSIWRSMVRKTSHLAAVTGSGAAEAAGGAAPEDGAAPGLVRVSRAMAPKVPRPLSQRTIAVQEFQKSSHGTVTRVKLITIKPNRDDAKAWSWQQYEEMTQRLGYKGVAGHSTNLWPRKKRVQRRPEPSRGVSR